MSMRAAWSLSFCAAALVGISACAAAPRVEPVDADAAPGTFSILGFDPETGEVGGAVQSRVFSVGSRNIWADAEAGAVVTQATVDVSYAPQSLALLKKGLAPTAIVKQLWENDPDPLPKVWSKHGRQFAVMNLKGEYAAFTGTTATPWAGHKGGKFCTAQGNILAGEAVVNDMVAAFEKATVICRSVWWRRSKRVRPPAATRAANSRPP